MGVMSSSFILSKAGVFRTAGPFSLPCLRALCLVEVLSMGVNSAPPGFCSTFLRSASGPLWRGVRRLSPFERPFRSCCRKSPFFPGEWKEASCEISAKSGCLLRYVASPRFVRGVSSAPPYPGWTMAVAGGEFVVVWRLVWVTVTVNFISRVPSSARLSRAALAAGLKRTGANGIIFLSFFASDQEMYHVNGGKPAEPVIICQTSSSEKASSVRATLSRKFPH